MAIEQCDEFVRLPEAFSALSRRAALVFHCGSAQGALWEQWGR
jgi:hypothetical protein